MHGSRALGPLFVLCLSACAASAQYTPSTSSTYPPKPANCQFAVVTALPDASFEQLGILDIHASNDFPITNAADFKTLVSPAVCNAGGDLVVAEVNGLGRYVRGSVFRQRNNPNVVTPASGASL